MVLLPIAHCFGQCGTPGTAGIVLRKTFLSVSPIYTQAANIHTVLRKSVSISHRYVISTWIIIFITLSTIELLIWIHSKFLSPQTPPIWIKTRDQQVLFLLFRLCMWFHYIKTKLLFSPVFLMQMFDFSSRASLNCFIFDTLTAGCGHSGSRTA